MNYSVLTYDLYGCLPAAYFLRFHILFRIMVDAYVSVGLWVHYVAKWKGITFMTSRQGLGVGGGTVML